MPISFPSNPTNGQQYTAANGITYTWDGNKWVANGGGLGSVVTLSGSQTITGLKTFTGGIVSQHYNFTLTGNSIFWTGPSLGPQWTVNDVTIAVNNNFSHHFFEKRFVVVGDGTKTGAQQGNTGVIEGVDSSLSGSAGVVGTHTQAQSGLGMGLLGYASNASYTGAVLQTRADAPTTGNYLHMRCYSAGATPVFTVSANGNVRADGTFASPAADYAEYFEWADGNPNKEDRVGITVALQDGKIRAAQPGDTVIGVVSVVPGVVGDAAELNWQGKYVTDDWGRPILDPCHHWTWEDKDGVCHSVASYATSDQEIPKNAKKVTVDGEGRPLTTPRLNPNYDSSKPYVPRSQRPEWSAIGLMGKLKVRRGQPVDARWIKLKNITDDIELWLVK